MGKKRLNQDDEVYNIMMADGELETLQKKKNLIKKYITKDIKLEAKNDKQKELIRSIKNDEITICSGPPGTGKTYVSLVYALNLIRKDKNKYKKIYLVKSVTTLKNEELGFLKGDLNDKIEPFMWSFQINLEKILNTNTIQRLKDHDIIKPFPLAYMRGASLDDCIIIADEIQNLTMSNARTLMTRIGNNSKLIMLGDVNQIDISNKHDSALEKIVELFKDVDKIGVVEMSLEDTNIRNPLINIIEEKFNEHNSKQKKEAYYYDNNSMTNNSVWTLNDAE